MTWSPDRLERIDTAIELEITTARADGTWRRWLPIWAVCAEDQVFVRTWYRRDTGWYGHAIASGHARVRVPGVEAEVTVEDVGVAARDAVDTAYRAKYGSGAESMVSDTAAATTLRLDAVH